MIIMTINKNNMLLSISKADAISPLLIPLILWKILALPDNHVEITALTDLHNDNYKVIILSFNEESGEETGSSCIRWQCAFKR